MFEFDFWILVITGVAAGATKSIVDNKLKEESYEDIDKDKTHKSEENQEDTRTNPETLNNSSKWLY